MKVKSARIVLFAVHMCIALIPFASQLIVQVMSENLGCVAWSLKSDPDYPCMVYGYDLEGLLDFMAIAAWIFPVFLAYVVSAAAILTYDKILYRIAGLEHGSDQIVGLRFWIFVTCGTILILPLALGATLLVIELYDFFH